MKSCKRCGHKLEKDRVMNPDKIYNVSQTQLSIARYYGGCKLNGEYYIYLPEEDALIKQSLLKKLKLKRVKLEKTSADSSMDLFEKGMKNENRNQMLYLQKRS